MNNEIEKSEQPSPEDVLAAITSFNDVTIVTNIFRDLGWNYSLEIKETLALAKQNANLSIKFKAIKYLRELLKEAAEASGYTAKVSQTIPNAQGGTTTFSARRISKILNPTKQIESNIKENQNDKKRLQSIESPSGCDEENRTEPNRGSDRGQSQTDERHTKDSGLETIPEVSRDTGRAFPAGDVESGGTEPPDGGEAPGSVPRGAYEGHTRDTKSNRPGVEDKGESPCIKTRPPTCDRELFPGISSAED